MSAQSHKTQSVRLHDKSFTLLYSRTEIAEKVQRLAKHIDSEYEGKDLLLISVLKGGYIFTADLSRAMQTPHAVEFIRASSYGSAMTTSGTVTMQELPFESLEGKHVIITEDIVDTGLTLSKIVEALRTLNPASIEVATLLIKPTMYMGDVQVKYVGFSIDPLFVVGYGLDYGELGRNLSDIFVVLPDESEE
jgi:hypoxanthine phosphoribosyltransferase